MSPAWCRGGDGLPVMARRRAEEACSRAERTRDQVVHASKTATSHSRGRGYTLRQGFGTGGYRWLGCCCGLLAGLLLVGACASAPSAYVERHHLNEVTVVFLDEESLQKEWERVTGNPAVAFRSSSGPVGAYALHTVRGFYDFRTRTIYCNKMDFEVCGHELHHAVLGRFHADH